MLMAILARLLACQVKEQTSHSFASKLYFGAGGALLLDI
jgi:hypothetical protein